MITEINIKNFKSIVDLTLPLSNINVFIGENGCGKSNILEAVGFACAVNVPQYFLRAGYNQVGAGENSATGQIDSVKLSHIGIRAAKPSLIFNSFAGKRSTNGTVIRFGFSGLGMTFTIKVYDTEDIFPKWIVQSVEDFIPPGTILSDIQEEARLSIPEALSEYLIYTLNTAALRSLSNESLAEPVGINGLNLNDDRQRLFVVKRNDDGHTVVERVKVKPSSNGEELKLSEMWMRGYLGALPNNF